jgi:hypothetical protein
MCKNYLISNICPKGSRYLKVSKNKIFVRNNMVHWRAVGLLCLAAMAAAAPKENVPQEAPEVILLNFLCTF